MMDCRFKNILVITANIIFIVGSFIYFLFYQKIDLIFSNFLSVIEYICIYLFSIIGLLVSSKLTIKTLSIITSGISLGKIFYNFLWRDLTILTSDDKRLYFLLTCLSVMIFHVLLWILFDLKFKRDD